jgi:hypothetical protein
VGASNGFQVEPWVELPLHIVLVKKMNRMIELVLRVCSWVGHTRFVAFALVLVGIAEQVLGIVEQELVLVGNVEQGLVGIAEQGLVDGVEQELVGIAEQVLGIAEQVLGIAEQGLVQADRLLEQADKLPELEQSRFAQHKIGLEKMIVPVVQLVGKTEQEQLVGTSG